MRRPWPFGNLAPAVLPKLPGHFLSARLAPERWAGWCLRYCRGRLDSLGATPYLFGMPRRVSDLRSAAFKDWLTKAHSILRVEHHARPGEVRPLTWTSWYFAGITPKEAARRASVEPRSALKPKKRRLRRI